MTKSNKLVKNYLAVTPNEMLFANRQKIFNETFSGNVTDIPIKFPKGLGAEHPFDFERTQIITQNIGVMNAAVDKIVDAIVGDFTVLVKDQNAQALIEMFNEQSNIKGNIRPWVKEGISKGNGFMELDLTENKIRVMNANNMFVKRNKKGKVIQYNQFVGNIRLFSSAKKELIPFKPSQIVHLTINKVPNDAYGTGLVWSNRVAIEHYAGAELILHRLMERKAGMPIHVKLGQQGESVQEGDIDNFKSKLQFMNNSTEWVTDANVDMKLLDFGGVGDNATKAAEHSLEQIAIGMKIPMAIMGASNNPEGLAKVNDKGFLRFISSIRLQIEEVIENKIYRPLLLANKLKSKIEFDWDLQGEDEKNERLRVLRDGLALPFISPELKAGIEKKYAEVLGLEEVIKVLPTPEQAAEENRIRQEEEEELKQPEVPGAKPTANQSHTIKAEEIDHSSHTHKLNEESKPELTEAQLNELPVSEYVNITPLEEKAFNYTDYLVKILQNLRTDKFDSLSAKSEIDLLEGLLPQRDIKKLRTIMKNGFRKNRTIRQIEKEISNSIELKDRVKVDSNGNTTLTLLSSNRPITIARTEATRLANQGLKLLYQENNVEQYRYLAALDDRTSQICNSLNGQVFNTADGTPGINMPPMHANCRSTIVGVII